ncbi:MarR family transcriptional regulator [Microbacterium sp.]|uniref:MarR family winged helix-turn-helix transcriptional regulator n=1 Tax=Microbacterium sp. TaxID=51671 RepID=UPI0025FCC4C2|nr:MarR family transcriptional regulator [Microbacterium sp.]
MTDEAGARADAVRALESTLSELIGQFRRLIAEAAHRISPDMLPGAYKLFTTIVRQDSVTSSALAELMMMDKGQISRTVRELEDLGLIARTPDPRDGRSSLLSATPEGLERLAAARVPNERGLEESIAAWGIDDIHRLSELLHALATGTRPAQ